MTYPVIKRGNLSQRIGTEVSSLEVTLAVSANVTQANVPLTQFVLDGGFDGANLTVRRFFAANYSTPAVGSMDVFSGRVAEIDVSACEISFQVKSDLELLNAPLPRNVYAASCTNTLYDTVCQLNSANFAVVGNVSNTSTKFVVTTNLTANAGYYDQGVVTFTAGTNNGAVRTVKNYANAQLTLAYPLVNTPQIGDTFTVRPGCDKSLTTCNSKFNNVVHFRGFPFIPVPETTY